MKEINSKNIDKIYDFDNFDDCKHFLNNFYIGKERVKYIQLSDGSTDYYITLPQVKMEDIPDSQIIQRANEIKGWINGGL